MRSELRSFAWRILLGCGTCALANPNVLASSSLSKYKLHHSFTEVRLMTPFSTNGINSKLMISDQGEGDCWASSSVNAARPNTWRCQAKGITYDPCFVNSIRHSTSVICMTNPWDNKAVKLTLNNPLPINSSKKFNQKSAQPWALELANGNHCTLISGPSLTVAGLKASYRCKNATVIGKINQSHPLWTVMYSHDHALYMSQTPVISAWY